MAIDKIVLEFQAETTKLKKELEDLKGRLGNVETAAKDAGKKTGKALDDVGKNANGLKDTIKNLGQQIAAAFAAREIIRFTKQTIDAASDLNETVSKSQQIFGDASKAVEDFASNSAKQFGQSKQQAIDAAASFGVFGKAAGLTGEDLSTFSTDLVALSADLASFGNTTPEEAALALGAALRGEAEPIRRFGVLLDDATLKQEALAMGLIKTTKGALTPQQKVLAANAVILKQTADAQGDFARTSDGVANQQRILEATFKDLQTEIGQKLLPTFNSALTSLNEFLGDLDAEDVLSFAKAIGFAATAFGAFKLGSLIKDMGGLTGMLKATTGGVQGLSKAVMSNPLGLLATAAAALIAYGPDLIEMFSDVTEFQKEIAKVSSEAGENLRKEQAELNLVADALARTNPQSEERARLLKRFNELSPVTIEDLKDEAEFNGQLKSALDSANSSFQQRIRLRAAEAVAQTASQKQIEAEAKAIEQSTEILMQNGAVNQKVLNQFRKEIEAGNVRTGFFTNIPEVFRSIGLEMGFSRNEAAKLFLQASNNIKAFDGYAESIKLSAEAGKELNNIEIMLAKSEMDAKTNLKSKEEQRYQGLLARKVYLNEKLTKDEEKELGLLEKKIKLGQQLSTEETAALSKLTTSTKENTDANDDNTKGKEKAKTALEKLNEELANLKTAQENATFEGDIETAKKYQNAISKLDNKLAIFKKTLEDIRGGVVTDDDLKKIDEASILSNEYLDDLAKAFGLVDDAKPDAMSIKVNLDVDEESAENAVVSIQAIHEAASNVAGGLSTLESNFGQMVGAFAALSGENAEYVKALAVIQVQIQMASAIAAAIAGATSSAATTGPGAPFVLAGYISSMVGAVVSAFAQTTQLLTAEVPKPGFYDGTAYLQRGGNPKGKDTIPVMAHEGEAIIPTRNNLQYPGLAKSWIDGNLDGYINNNFVRPALMEQQKQAEEDFADRLAASMALQMSSNFDDYRLYRAIKEQTAVNRTGFETMKINRKKIRGGR